MSALGLADEDRLALEADERRLAAFAFAATCQRLHDERTFAAELRARAAEESNKFKRKRLLDEAKESDKHAHFTEFELRLLPPNGSPYEPDERRMREVYREHFGKFHPDDVPTADVPARDSDTGTGTEPPHPGFWNSATERVNVHDAIDTLRGQATARIGEPETIRDVLLTEHRGPCFKGKRVHESVRSKGTVENSYRVCRRFSCPRCAPGALTDVVVSVLDSWRGVPVYRHVFTSAEDWRSSKRAERLRTAFPSNYLRVPLPDESEWVFTPGDSEEGGGELLLGHTVGLTLLDAMLRKAPTGARISRPKAAEDEDDATGEDSRTEPDDPMTRDRLAFILPSYLSPEEANKLVAAALGRDVTSFTLSTEAGYWRRYVLSGLTPEEVDAVRVVMLPHMQAARDEQRTSTFVGNIFDTLFALTGLCSGRATARQVADAMHVSASKARTYLKALYERGSVTRERDGRAYVFTVVEPVRR